METVLKVGFLACLFVCAIASADQVDDTLRLASSKRADERALAAWGLPDIMRVRGVAVVRLYYQNLLSDQDEIVVAETLIAIKRTPSSVSVNGTQEKTVGFLKKLLPRVDELCKSSNKTTAQFAREARDRIRQVERKRK